MAHVVVRLGEDLTESAVSWRYSRAERVVIVEVICWPPMEILTSAIEPLIRTGSVPPPSCFDHSPGEVAPFVRLPYDHEP